MRATCSICTELFTSDSEISAVPCGHTFHEECLSQWFKESKTCPQCRKKVVVKSVIHKLFFTEDDAAQDEPDVAKLRNELDSVKASVRERDREKAQLRESADKLEKRIKGLEETTSSVKSLYQQEKSKNSTLRQELGYAKKVQCDVTEARQEAARLKEKLRSLRTVEDFVNGMIPDIEQKTRNASVEDLAKWCVIQEKELRRKKNDCNKLQEEQRTRSKELIRVKHLLDEKSKKLEVAQDKLRTSEEDVTSLERQNTSLKKKLEALSSDMGTRHTTERLTPTLPNKRPRLSLPDGDDMGSFDLDMDIISPKDKRQEGFKENQQKNNCKEFGTKYVKISSAAAGAKSMAKVKSASDIGTLPGLGNLNILRKTIHQGSMLAQEGSSIKKGYNGLGGHEKFIHTQGRTLLQAKPKLKKPGTSKVFKPSLTNPPPFPSLNAFNTG